MALTLILTTLKLGLINGLTVLALFLSYSMLNVCDLSTDGCFTIGAAVGTMVALAGHPYLSIPAAMLAGVASGFITAFLQTKMGINSLLAGIIVNTGLYSVNMAILGNKAAVSLIKSDTVFSVFKGFIDGILVKIQEGLEPGSGAEAAISEFRKMYLDDVSKTVIALIAVTLVIVFLSIFLKTKLGLSIRATGDNPNMVRSSSINPVYTTVIGLCISGSITALSGCLFAQAQKSVSIDIGSGMVTVALASLLIGGVLVSKGKIPVRAVFAVVGSIIFRLVYTIALRFHMPAYMLKLVSSVIVIIAISAPYLKQKFPLIKRRFLHRFGKNAGTESEVE